MARGRRTEDERRAFEEAMRDVRPLERKTGPAIVAQPAAAAVAPRAPVRKASPGLDVSVRDGERYLLLASGVDRGRLRALADGLPQGQLDLHGHGSARARATLRAFLERARQQGWQRVLVIHGRGHRSGPEGPVLRDCVLDTLLAPPLADQVLAVINAPAALGGLGAALMLLRGR
jgi:DNA-nicking Smr family endonuclease